MNALILGATGLVGSHCLRLLLEDPRYDRVFALVRRSTGVESEKLREVPFDLATIETLLPAESVDHVYCAFGTTIKKAGSQEKMLEIDVEIPYAVARRTLVLGATHFSLVSSLGANASSRIFYSRIKGELEDMISALGFRSVTVFRPSVIGGDRPGDSRAAERIGQWAMTILPKRWRTISAERIARAMINQAQKSDPGTTVIESAGVWPLSDL